MTTLAHNSDITAKFLSHVMPVGTTLELRIPQSQYIKGNFIGPSPRFSQTLAGWYDSPASFMVDAGKLRGVNGYVTANPCDPALLARSYNQLVASKHTTKDENIVCLRWAFVDIDPIRPADISSSNAELATALGRRDAILAAHPELAACSLTGCSGNGAFILVRLPDLPNDEVNKKFVADTLAILSAKHSDDAVKVDVTTKNPARIMGIPGNIKCKGSQVGDRVWRRATLDDSMVVSGQTFDLVSFVAEHAAMLPSDPATARRAKSKPGTTIPPSPSPNASYATLDASTDDAERIFRAARYLSSIEPAIAGQGGHDQTYDAACALVKGYDLRPELARPILEEWNKRCQPPWASNDIDHKLRDADETVDDKPRGYLFDSVKPAASVPAVAGQPNAPAPVPDPDNTPIPMGTEACPFRLGKSFLRKTHNHEEGYTLRFWQEEFHHWIGGAYHYVAKGELKGSLATFAQEDFEKIYYNQLAAMVSSSDPSKIPRPIPVTTNLTANIVQAMSGIVQLKAAQHPAQPCWLDGDDQWQIADIIPMKNEIVHLPSYLAGQPCTRKPTPRLFTEHVLKYEWEPNAPKPVRWLEFLKGIWPDADDQESIDTLQEWFGLNLVPVTKYQKMMAFIGPPRAGKGVISSILREMVGPENCAGPTLNGLVELFGMQSLIGKLSAIVDDARISGKSDHAVIAERLLSISGEGCLDVRRMHRSQWTGVLPCRVTLISNELPRLNDNSNALANRFIILKFTKSHLGKEDSSLKATFLRELPGILLWAIEGLRRLTERGHFIQPKSAVEIHEEMEDMASPVGSFVRDCCSVHADDTVDKSQIYLAWKQWCEVNGKKEVGELNVFCRNLRSVVPGLKARRLTRGSRQERVFQGVGLLPPSEMFGEAPAVGGVGESESGDEVGEGAGYTDESGVPF